MGRHCIKNFTNIISFVYHRNPMRRYYYPHLTEKEKGRNLTKTPPRSQSCKWQCRGSNPGYNAGALNYRTMLSLYHDVVKTQLWNRKKLSPHISLCYINHLTSWILCIPTYRRVNIKYVKQVF